MMADVSDIEESFILKINAMCNFLIKQDLTQIFANQTQIFADKSIKICEYLCVRLGEPGNLRESALNFKKSHTALKINPEGRHG